MYQNKMTALFSIITNESTGWCIYLFIYLFIVLLWNCFIHYFFVPCAFFFFALQIICYGLQRNSKAVQSPTEQALPGIDFLVYQSLLWSIALSSKIHFGSKTLTSVVCISVHKQRLTFHSLLTTEECSCLAVLLEEHMKDRPKVVTHFTPVYPSECPPHCFLQGFWKPQILFYNSHACPGNWQGPRHPAERPTDVPVEPAWWGQSSAQAAWGPLHPGCGLWQSRTSWCEAGGAWRTFSCAWFSDWSCTGSPDPWTLHRSHYSSALRHPRT